MANKETGQNIDTSIIYLTTKDVSEKTGLAHNTLSRHVREGRLKALKHKNVYYYRAEDVEEFIHAISRLP